MPVLMRIVGYGIAAAIATLVVATISSRLIEFEDATSVVVFALVIGAINAFIKPVVSLLTLPLTCLTFGLFALVVNAVLFKAGAEIAPDLAVSWWGAFVGSILTSIFAGFVYSVLDEQ